MLPLGSLEYVLFCTNKIGWGWDSFMDEVNAGEGLKFPKGLKAYVSYGIPLIIAVIYLKGYYDKFSTQGPAVFAVWMAIGIAFLLMVFMVSRKKKPFKHQTTYRK